MRTTTPRLMGKTSHGFTIVELLIVVVIIAILAAITVVAYNGIQNQTHDAVVEADLSSAAKKLELYKAENGRYPATAAEMPTGFTIAKASYDQTQNNVYYCNDKVNHTYALGLRSKTLKGYIQTSNGRTDGVTVNGSATCAAIGKTWANDTTTATSQGHSSGAGSWNTTWPWIQ